MALRFFLDEAALRAVILGVDGTALDLLSEKAATTEIVTSVLLVPLVDGLLHQVDEARARRLREVLSRVKVLALPVIATQSLPPGEADLRAWIVAHAEAAGAVIVRFD
ncbi:MAG: hypothetical protein U1E15_04905 [Hyphomicrobiales bacterium]